jgi:hypothetical protein
MHGQVRGSITRALAGVAAAMLVAACQPGSGGSASVPPGATGSSSVTTGPSPRQPVEGEFVVVAAGDIVCEPSSSDFDGHEPDSCQHGATANLVGSADAVLVLGDLQYEDGAHDEFHAGYARSWGRFADITYPAPGNHDYHTDGARGYFYFWRTRGRPTGGDSGFYSFDAPGWHLISLNSNCSDVPCDEGTPQDEFLERDLAQTDEECILAYWHHPYFNSGSVHGDSTAGDTFWQDLYAARADLVLNGHEHNYQRYGKQDPSGRATSDGIRQFIAGTGGRSLYELSDEKDPNYETGDDQHFGVLRLFLAEDSYSWEFVAVGGHVVDHGGPVSCN